MPDIEKILRELLANRRLKESATFTSRTYGDQPIIQTGKQMRERAERNRPGISSLPRTDYTPDRPWQPTSAQPARPARTRPQAPEKPRQLSFEQAAPQGVAGQNVPERYYQLRAMAAEQPTPSSYSFSGALAYGSRSANRLFYEQACFMEDFEDDYEFHGTYSQYFPTYSSMTLSQLRGYFSWRTQVRAGKMPEAPLSFAFLHVYELLCGIGTTPGEQGFIDLVAFRDAFSQTDAAQGSTFSSYLRRWLRDYVAYHDLDPALLSEAAQGMQAQVYTLLRAEEETLAANKLARKEGALASEATDTSPVTDEQLLAALNECSSYQICGARLYKDKPDDVRRIACEAFRALVVHCSRRRKTDFVEGLFGSAYSEPYTMFSSAVFYEPEPHADASVTLSPVETLVCRDGRWRRYLLCSSTSRSSELGAILHAADKQLRDKLDYAYPLKERQVAAYIKRLINKAINELLAEQAEAEKRRITIDLSQLGHIRAAAAVTQEALLTDEERGTEPGDAEGAGDSDELPHAFGAPKEAPLTETPAPSASPGSGDSPLSSTEIIVVRALLNGEDAPSNPDGQLLSLLIDSINEKLFDIVGDAVIEFDGDAPVLIEDYEQDVREILGL